MHTYQWNNRFVQTGGQAPDVFWIYIYIFLYIVLAFFWGNLHYWSKLVIVHP